jgi:MSHA biogenesis protein MshJ
VEVVVRGPYPALVAYLQTLQRNPNRIFWAKVRLDVATYPQAVLMLTVYTVSNRAESPLG